MKSKLIRRKEVSRPKTRITQSSEEKQRPQNQIRRNIRRAITGEDSIADQDLVFAGRDEYALPGVLWNTLPEEERRNFNDARQTLTLREKQQQDRAIYLQLTGQRETDIPSFNSQEPQQNHPPAEEAPYGGGNSHSRSAGAPVLPRNLQQAALINQYQDPMDNNTNNVSSSSAQNLGNQQVQNRVQTIYATPQPELQRVPVDLNQWNAPTNYHSTQTPWLSDDLVQLYQGELLQNYRNDNNISNGEIPASQYAFHIQTVLPPITLTPEQQKRLPYPSLPLPQPSSQRGQQGKQTPLYWPMSDSTTNNFDNANGSLTTFPLQFQYNRE
jgi:hypothetical protein